LCQSRATYGKALTVAAIAKITKPSLGFMGPANGLNQALLPVSRAGPSDGPRLRLYCSTALPDACVNHNSKNKKEKIMRVDTRYSGSEIQEGAGVTSSFSRRSFLQATALTTSGLLLAKTTTLDAGPPAELPSPWYRAAYRRNVIDMHITDWNEKFLSEFDPENYVELLRLCQVKSSVVYAQSHVGLCNFPTKVGRTHNGLKGKDHLKKVIELCHQHGIGVQLYFSVIFDRWAYDSHPDWRIILVNGKAAAEKSRYGTVCPNSPYREYVSALIEEMCAQLDFEGIRFDMTFWPAVCYCVHCQKRFETEVGGKLPTVIHWEDSRWVSFQRKREAWLIEFASFLTHKVKSLKPKATVEHQASTYTHGWRLGVTEGLSRADTFLQGDFYGDARQGSFARKFFYNLSENLPYGFETSVMVSLQNHTAKKSKDLLRAKAYACLADSGAFVFIDGIDPVGTLNRSVYEQMGQIFGETKGYEKYLGGKLCQDVGIYVSTESKCDFADNGKTLDDPNLSNRLPHLDAALSVCNALIDHHVPYGVITKKSLGNLSQHKVLVLPNVLMMDKEEAGAIRDYVQAGGRLYASKYTSLIAKDGKRQADFLLADLFGGSFGGETKESYTYIAPVDDTQKLFEGFTRKYPIGLDSSQIIVRPNSGVKVLGTITLPYSDPSDLVRFVSIHGNPPGIPTDHPAIILNQFGTGHVIYVSGELENSEVYRPIFINLIRQLFGSFTFEADAPQSVEVSAFHQEEKRRYLVSLVNFQKDLPNIPVDNVCVKVRLERRRVKRVVSLPDERKLDFEVRDQLVQIQVPRLETFHMMALDYE
jgi:Hypothetical glycosyl hydrolase 6/Beta-galactosidase trimerisation domain